MSGPAEQREEQPREAQGQLLVTGASRGIGRAICQLQGGAARTLGVYRDNHAAALSLFGDVEQGAVEQGAADLEARLRGGELIVGARLSLLAADLSTDAGISGLVRCIHAENIELSGVVFNAGISLNCGLGGEGGRAALAAELQHNLAAPLLLLSALLDADLLLPGAALVFISSNLVRHAVPGRVGYAASKAGLEAAVRQLCLELGPRGVRVNAVAPGIIRTDMVGHMSEQLLTEYAAQTPLGRVGEAADVARAVAFLLGGGASYISGQVLDVDGGWGVR